MIKKLMIAFILAVLLVSPAFASKERDVKKGNALYKKGQYDKAIVSYESALKKDPESPQINFNTGVAYYKKGDYTKAIAFLQKGLLTDDLKLKQSVHYNLCNALYAKANEIEDKNPSLALNVIQRAKDQCESALKLDDKDKDALYNYEAAKKKEEEIAKKVPKKKSPFGKNGEDGKLDEKNDKSGGHEDENSRNIKEQENAKNSFEDENSEKSSSGSGGENKEEQDKEKFNANSADDGDDSAAKDEHEGMQLKPGEMTKEEARDLLKQFEQNEQPVGLLNFGKNKFQERPVLKDW